MGYYAPHYAPHICCNATTVMRGRGAVKITWGAAAAALVPFQAEGNLYTGPATARRRCMASKRTSVRHRTANPSGGNALFSTRETDLMFAAWSPCNGLHARRIFESQ
jgi:hypothetical protein